VKSLVELLVSLLQEAGDKCKAPVVRDVKTLRQRVKDEGESFITITLPEFSKHFERSLADTLVAPRAFPAFKRGASPGFPAFMSGFLRQIFDKSGKLLETPSVTCIEAVRQIALFAKKPAQQCSQERQRAAADAYLQCDDEVQMEPIGQLWRYYRLVARVVIDSLCLDNGLWQNLRPRHGRGATGERLSRNSRWLFRTWHRRLEQAGFTWADFGRAQASLPSHEEGVDPVRFVESWNEQPVRVVFVPKTAASPRVIAVEPACMQYAQQALRNHLTERLEKAPLTAGRINFRDQTKNQMLAKLGSKTGHLATIDLSEASDRVGLGHVEALFEAAPQFKELLLASRSMTAKLSDVDRKVVLRKFASMGSAVTFPVESLAFFIIIIASRIRRAGDFPHQRVVAHYAHDTHVYGDDLIVPSDEANDVCEDLEAMGLKVNRRKSFWTGKFRESCGEDCYDGHRITPVYLREQAPASVRDASRVLSWVATSNQLFQAGYPATAMLLRKSVERITGLLPEVSPDSPALGWHYLGRGRPQSRWNKRLQRKEFRCWTQVSPKEPDPLEGDGALGKCLWLLGQRPRTASPLTWGQSVDHDHLVRSVTPYGVALKRRWVSAETVRPGVDKTPVGWAKVAEQQEENTSG